MTDEFNPETASLEELKARSAAEQPTEQPEQKRNADGTFAATPKTEAPTPDPDDIPEEKTIYQRRIDLGDGSGVQVFSADSLEELVDKLTDAQVNATKKIREQQAELGKARPHPQTKERTPDEEFVLSQELMSKPSKAIAKLFEETVGMPISEFKTSVQRVKVFEEAQASEKAGQDFVNQTPEYFGCVPNHKKMTDYLRTYKLPVTVDNLTKAFNELTSIGLLQTKPTETPTQVKNDPPPTERRPRSSGLNNRNNATPVVQTGPTEEELYKMPLEKLKELSLAAEREQQ